ncbi:MAG: DUF2330 domain-containing protein [Deltaproteobacteria bacterium]|nr:DUF2330 domain-containing protein [Deltaproteobacteria bacterium]
MHQCPIARPRTKQLFVAAIALILVLGLPPTLSADPCGMVPPIYDGPGRPITRVGAQQTYVFYHQGVETFVIRPGFRGKVDNFGMLIPFPTPPAIRKVADQTFAQIAAAIDPPEIVAYVYRRHFRRKSGRGRAPAPARQASLATGKRDVRVLRKEAIGMYEVAVLEAGSAQALKRWMDSHGYKYPDGMDQACEDYVKAGWCFVAVKTRVGPKAPLDPKPGMRQAKTALPDSHDFQGHVQGMGFRFRSKQLVVPMRLSAFNEGRLRNIVYLLTDGPRKIQRIADKYVVRQLPGWQVYRNLTRPLPLRVVGGSYRDLRPWQRQNLSVRRNPEPHNGIAAELFASDLLAAQKRRLSHRFEEREKALLNIGENLGLRGPAIDQLHAKALEEHRSKALRYALSAIKQLTLNVVDGDFPREVLANSNLQFAWYRMPGERNNKRNYDATHQGPTPYQPAGKLYRGALPATPAQQQRLASHSTLWVVGVSSGAALLLLLAALFWRRATAPLLGLLLVAWVSNARAESLDALLGKLKQPKQAPQAAKALAALGEPAISKLLNIAFDADDLETRGWALVAIGQSGARRADGELKKLHDNPNHPLLVRTWAAAARINLAADANALMAMTELTGRFPATARPLGQRLTRVLAQNKQLDTEGLLMVSARLPALRSSLSPLILALPAKQLVEVMVRGKSASSRQQAAAYLATQGRSNAASDTVIAAVIAAYRFDRRAKQVPWQGGALFIPSLNWKAESARRLVGNLLRWHLWCEHRGRSDLQRQLHNNLRSLALASAAGYRSPGWSNVSVESWLRSWAAVVGRSGIARLLAEQGLAGEPRYKILLSSLAER